MRTFLRIVGVAAILIGLLWIGQGTGLILWPASSFLLVQTRWAIIGAVLAALGVLLLWRAGRRR